MGDVDIVEIARGLQSEAFNAGAKDYQELILEKLQIQYDIFMDASHRADLNDEPSNSERFTNEAQGIFEAMWIIRNTHLSVDARFKE